VVVLDEPEPLAIAADPEPELPREPEPEPAPALPSTLDPHRSPPATYEEREVVCEIAFWRGYVSGQFYAHLRGDAKLSAVATSPTFRCRTEVPAETEESLAAVAALTDALVGDGWEPAGSGRAWYAQRFTARVAL
jgi:hypothetical protein